MDSGRTVSREMFGLGAFHFKMEDSPLCLVCMQAIIRWAADARGHASREEWQQLARVAQHVDQHLHLDVPHDYVSLPSLVLDTYEHVLSELTTRT